ncbi:MAG: TlpA disulfide reductase family protein [Actinomycetes bacterium]
MRRIALPLIAILAATGFVALIVFGVSQTGDDRTLDQAVAKAAKPIAPGLTDRLPSLSGSAQSLADYRGQVIVLNLWASWCPPCRDEAPLLERTQLRIAKEGATVIGVTWNDSVPDAKEFARKTGMTYPQLRDVTGSFAKAYGTKGLPETFIINRQGRVVALNRGEITASFLAKSLDPLLTPVKK